MSHPSEERLILFLVGDEEDRAGIRSHVDACPRCRREIEGLRAVLGRVRDLPVPEPDAGFEERILARRPGALRSPPTVTGAREIETSGGAARSSVWGRRLALAAALAASLVIAFLVGRHTPRGHDGAQVSGPGTDRVLLVSVGEHLERTRMVLLELVNAEDGGAIRARQAQAQSLIEDNRLYRQTAQLSERPAVAEVLDEVERVLLEVARSSDEMPAEELAWLRRRIADRDLLFKVSVIEGSARADADVPRSARPSW